LSLSRELSYYSKAFVIVANQPLFIMKNEIAPSSSHQDLVSVIIPCYNHGHFLGEAIESVINQSYPHIEIIVVDDGSTDSTEQVAKAYPSIHYVRQNNCGLSRSRNVGLSYSKGTYVIFLDADDCLFPDAIDIGLKALASRNDCALTFGLFAKIGVSQGLQQLSRDTSYGYKDLLQRNVIGNPGSVLYHRKVFTEIGVFDESNSSSADYDLYLRVARQFPIFCHHQLVVQYRKHGTNMSNDAGLMLASTVAVLKKQLRHVQGNQELRVAYDHGLQYYIHYYGERLIRQIYGQIHQGHLLDTVFGIYILIRFYPNRFLIYARRKIAYHISFFRKEHPHP